MSEDFSEIVSQFGNAGFCRLVNLQIMTHFCRCHQVKNEEMFFPKIVGLLILKTLFFKYIYSTVNNIWIHEPRIDFFFLTLYTLSQFLQN